MRYAGLATQRSTVIAWDRETGQALSPAISWQDTRAQAYINTLAAAPEEIKARTGLYLSAHYGASKLHWLVEHIPAVQRAAMTGELALGPLCSFLLFHLLQQQPFIVDHANAARTLLFNIDTHQWDDYLLETFEINPKWLPEPVPIRNEFGYLKGTDITLTAVCGDQPAALYGQGPITKNNACINIGTGAFVMIEVGSRLLSHPKLLHGIIDSDSRRCTYNMEGTVNGAGAALQWVSDTWSIPIPRAADWRNVSDPPIFINTVGGLGSPWWRSGIVPRFMGNYPQICVADPYPCITAVLESIVFLLYKNIEELRSIVRIINRLSVSGGLSHYEILCQGLADLSGVVVTRSSEPDVSARGIAWLASDRSASFSSTRGLVFQPKRNIRLEKRYRLALSLLQQSLS